MLRVCKDRKRKYLSLGISINPIHWDFTKGKPKPRCPNREQLETLVPEETNVYSEKILELKSREREFTAITLVEQVNNPTKQKTANDVFLEQLQRLTDENRRGYMLSTKQVYNSLIEFNKHLDIYFPDIDVAWLRKYETWF